MKALYHTTILSFLITFISCQQENYDIDLDQAGRKLLVVDGRVNSHTKRIEVNLSHTSDFFADEPKQFIDDALVFVSINSGGENQLTYAGRGNYILDNIEVAAGTRYDLRVVWEDEEYTSATEMQDTIPVEAFIIQESPSFGPDSGATEYDVNMVVIIDLLQTNYYMTEGFLYDPNTDAFGNREYLPWDDGPYASNPAIFPFFVAEYLAGDSVKIKFQHINKSTYDFYTSLTQVEIQNPSSLAPANPASNISNGAIGNFGAFAVHESYLTVTP